jgi:hypothetical protein
MGKKKTKTTSTNTYGWQTPSDTKDMTAYRDLATQGADFTSPLVHQFARAEEGIQNQIFEGDLNPAVRDQIKRSQLTNLRMDKGAALSDAKMREHGYKTGNYANIASMTAPRLVQTGGTGTQTVSDPMGWLGPAMQGGASVAGGAMM